MKKILISLVVIFITLAGFSQTQLKYGLIVGKTSGVATVDSITKYGNIFKVYDGATRLTESDVINDTIEQRINDATPIGDIAWEVGDTLESPGNIVTYNQLQSFSGGGGGTASYDFIRFRVNITTGAPVTGDSSFTHTSFIGKHITAIREGQVQQQHTNNTESDGFWFNNATGELIFKPVFGANEQMEIWATSTILWNELAIEGSESTLLTNLVGFYAMDEVLGTAITDETGIQNGTTTATVNATGFFGKAEEFNGTTCASVPTNVSQKPTASVFSVSFRFKLQTTASGLGRDVVLARSMHSVSPWEGILFYLDVATNKLVMAATNSTATTYYANTTTACTSTANWYDVTGVIGAAGVLKLYLNGVDDTEAGAGTFTGTILQHDQGWSIGNNYAGDVDGGIDGYIDDFCIHNTNLSAGQALEYSTKTYPFN